MQTVLKYALGALLTLTGSSAIAEDHEVRMERYGYFPNTIYVQPGDTITFVNRTPNWAQVFSYDSNDNNSGYDWNNPCGYLIGNESGSDVQKRFGGDGDGWSIGWFSKGSTRTIDVTECMETEILAPYIWQYSFNANKFRANIVFGEAPTS